MDKIKLDRVLFEFMEKMTKEGKYNYEQFIHELSMFVEYSYNYYPYETLKDKELKPYFRGGQKEETLKKLLKAFIFGYEEENKYTIVLFEKSGCEFVLWEIEDEYIIDIRDGFNENESAKSSFTPEEITEKFPRLAPLAQLNK